MSCVIFSLYIIYPTSIENITDNPERKGAELPKGKFFKHGVYNKLVITPTKDANINNLTLLSKVIALKRSCVSFLQYIIPASIIEPVKYKRKLTIIISDNAEDFIAFFCITALNLLNIITKTSKTMYFSIT